MQFYEFSIIEKKRLYVLNYFKTYRRIFILYERFGIQIQ